MTRSAAVLLAALTPLLAEAARIDTLRGPSQIEDATIYGYLTCDGEISGEDCRRYNTGNCLYFSVGTQGTGNHRAVLRFPGWDGVVPDSSVLELFCELEDEGADRRIFLYPLTRRFVEGVEGFGAGGIPADSGVTWNHAWLAHGRGDSLSWTSPGGDFTAAVACTLIAADSGKYQRVAGFNRMLAYWDSTGSDPGVILIGENVFPANTAKKTFTSAEGAGDRAPRLLLYYPGAPVAAGRRRLQSTAAPAR